MEISNMQAVNYVNTIGQMKHKRLPVKILFALNHNFNLIVKQVIPGYEQTLKKLQSNAESGEELDKKIVTLVNEKVELEVKTVPAAEFEKLDEDASCDRLTMVELDAISFMIT